MADEKSVSGVVDEASRELRMIDLMEKFPEKTFGELARMVGIPDSALAEEAAALGITLEEIKSARGPDPEDRVSFGGEAMD